MAEEIKKVPSSAENASEQQKKELAAISDAGKKLISNKPAEQAAALKALEWASEAVKKDKAFTEALKNSLENSKLPQDIRTKLEALQTQIAPQAAFDRVTEHTNTPSEAMKKMAPKGKINPTELAKFSPEKIKEAFSVMNKADLVVFLKNIPETSAQANEKQEIDRVKSVVTQFLEEMIKNGFTIESKNDIALLTKFGSENVKMAIWSLKDYDGKSKLILMKTKDGYSTLPPIQDNKLINGLDLSRLNTASATDVTKAMEAQAKAGNIDPAKLRENFSGSIDHLLGSNNAFMKGLGEFMKFFGKLLGFYKEGEKMAIETKEKEVAVGWKVERLGMMLDPNSTGKDLGYSIDDVEFDQQFALKNPESQRSQKYLADVQKILGIHETTKDTSGREILAYGEKTQKATIEWQKKLLSGNDKQTGKFDHETAAALLEHLKPKATPTPAPEAPKPEAALAKTPEAPKINEKKVGEYSIDADQIGALKDIIGKTRFSEYKNNPKYLSALSKLLQTSEYKEWEDYSSFNETDIKAIQKTIKVKPDGNFGLKSVNALENFIQNWGAKETKKQKPQPKSRVKK